VHQQLAEPILNLRAAGDGVHRVMIQLHPVDLGPVNVELRMHDGAVTIAMTSGNEATRDTVRAALGHLHHELASAGLTDVRVSVDGTAADLAGRQQRQQEFGEWSRPKSSRDVMPTFASDREQPSQPVRLRIESTTGVDRWL
jgi:flagellar hook-length control protein FliK